MVLYILLCTLIHYFDCNIFPQGQDASGGRRESEKPVEDGSFGELEGWCCGDGGVIRMGGLVSNYKTLLCISLNVICMGGLVSNYKTLLCISLNVICMGGLVSNYSIRQKNLPCTVRFTPDRLSQTALKRILNGPQTGAERTVHGPFRFMYVAHTYGRIYNLIFFNYFSTNSNSASHLPV